MNILLIDDDNDTTFLIDLLLSKMSFVEEYYLKLRAKDALEFLSLHSKPLSCIFVDINMPEMDGFQFVETYEREFRHKFPETAVYFLTSSARQIDKKRAMGFPSVKDFILKPLSQAKLDKIHHELKYQ